MNSVTVYWLRNGLRAFGIFNKQYLNCSEIKIC